MSIAVGGPSVHCRNHSNPNLGLLALVTWMRFQNCSWFCSSHNSNLDSRTAKLLSAWGFFVLIIQLIALKELSRMFLTGLWLAVWDRVITLTVSKYLFKKRHLAPRCPLATALKQQSWTWKWGFYNPFVHDLELGRSNLDEASASW